MRMFSATQLLKTTGHCCSALGSPLPRTRAQRHRARRQRCWAAHFFRLGANSAALVPPPGLPFPPGLDAPLAGAEMATSSATLGALLPSVLGSGSTCSTTQATSSGSPPTAAPGALLPSVLGSGSTCSTTQATSSGSPPTAAHGALLPSVLGSGSTRSTTQASTGAREVAVQTVGVHIHPVSEAAESCFPVPTGVQCHGEDTVRNDLQEKSDLRKGVCEDTSNSSRGQINQTSPPAYDETGSTDVTSAVVPRNIAGSTPGLNTEAIANAIGRPSGSATCRASVPRSVVETCSLPQSVSPAIHTDLASKYRADETEETHSAVQSSHAHSTKQSVHTERTSASEKHGEAIDAREVESIANVQAGDLVCLRDLHSRPDLNGAYGAAVTYYPSKLRWSVELLESGEKLLLKTANVTVVQKWADMQESLHCQSQGVDDSEEDSDEC